ncbi:MAG TPA: RcnB family protein [Caulobacteraceae bacterium]|jgi:hypothetical protein
MNRRHLCASALLLLIGGPAWAQPPDQNNRPGGGERPGGGRPGGERPGGQPGGGGTPGQRPGGNERPGGQPGGGGPGQRPGGNERPGGGPGGRPGGGPGPRPGGPGPGPGPGPRPGGPGFAPGPRPGPPAGFRPLRGGRPFRYPRGYSYRSWGIGDVLPSIFLGSTYYFTNYASVGLGPPPRGDRWVRYGPDLLLVQRRTGRIIQVIPNAFL